MDPNETLANIRLLLEGGYFAGASILFKDLDEWLSKGGFPPEAWMPQADDNEFT